MHVHKFHLYFSILTGLVAVCAAFPSQGENIINGTTAPDGPYAEIVYVDVGPDDTIQCVADDPGYVYLMDQANGTIDVDTMTLYDEDPPLIVESPGVRLFRLNGTLPELVADLHFDEKTLAENGHAFVEAGPFQTPPPEQIVTLTNGDGDLQVLLLETPYIPGLHFDCTVFEMEEVMDGSTGLVAKKKAAKKKVAKANKRKVHKKKALKKAIAKKKKAATPGS